MPEQFGRIARGTPPMRLSGLAPPGSDWRVEFQSPTFPQSVGAALYQRLLPYVGERIAAGVGDAAEFGADLFPGMSMAEGHRKFAETGETPSWLDRGMMIAETIPGAKLATGPLRKAAKELASTHHLIYNPIPQPQRSFYDDYAQTPRSDATGKLQTSIEGRELVAPLVAGRRRVAEGDTGLLPEESFWLADQLARSVNRFPAGQMRGKSGRLRREHTPDASNNHIDVSSTVPEEKVPLVVAHEVGHILDNMALPFDMTGVRKELEQVYSDLATGKWAGRHYGERVTTRPKKFGYKHGEETDDELRAEAYRAYMADPNYFKTKAPEAARRMREATERNPKIRKFIQLNALAPFAAAPVMYGATGLGRIGSGQAAPPAEQY